MRARERNEPTKRLARLLADALRSPARNANRGSAPPPSYPANRSISEPARGLSWKGEEKMRKKTKKKKKKKKKKIVSQTSWFLLHFSIKA